MKIDDKFFWFKSKQEFGTTIWYSNKYILKIEDLPHPYKRNNLKEEVKIIEKLNSLDCISVPRLISYGKYRGKNYYITERVSETGRMRDVDALFSFLELKGCGVIHGDLGRYKKKWFRRIDNVLFNGEYCILVDYDQAIVDAVVSGLKLNDLFKYLDSNYKKVQEYCGTLEWQLKRFNYDKYFIDGRLDITNSTLMKKGISTNSDNGNYYSIDESTVFSSGERGIEGRFPAINMIDFDGEKILDVGCNTGALARYIAKRGAKQVDGLEYSKQHALVGQMINSCEGIHNSKIKHHNIGEQKIIKRYDTILLFSMLHHVKDIEFAINEVQSHCNRILFETGIHEQGYTYRNDKWVKTNEWKFPKLDDLIKYFEKIFTFKFSKNYGEVDRNRYILEFIKS